MPQAKVAAPNGYELYEGRLNIFDPAQVKYVERTDFLKGICGRLDQEDNLEDIVMKNLKWDRSRFGHYGTPEQLDLYEMAKTYYMLRNKGARLPKFSRWVTSMFNGNQKLAKLLADEGQKAAKRSITMSVDLIDILRNADTEHFHSCFRRTNPSMTIDQKAAMKNYEYNAGRGQVGYAEFQYMGVRIAEDCPGIGIVYVDDENGKMMGRHWMHHGRELDTGKDILVLTQSRYGCLEGANIARLMASKGINVAIGSYYGEAPKGADTKIEYIGCFTKDIHHDLQTWGAGPHMVTKVKPAF